MSTANDLNTLLTELLPAKNKWKDIGLVFGLEDHDIAEIQPWKNNQDALRDILSIVLQRRKITWKDVVKALEDPKVKADKLADEISKKYGNYPRQEYSRI